MKKLHVISVKENDKWELDLSSYSPKAIKDRKDELLKIHPYKHIKVNHFTMDEEQYGYKVTLGIYIAEHSAVNISSITITPDILRCLEDDSNILPSVHIKYNMSHNQVIIYLSAINESDVLLKLESIIENVISVINNRLDKNNNKNIVDIINNK